MLSSQWSPCLRKSFWGLNVAFPPAGTSHLNWIFNEFGDVGRRPRFWSGKKMSTTLITPPKFLSSFFYLNFSYLCGRKWTNANWPSFAQVFGKIVYYFTLEYGVLDIYCFGPWNLCQNAHIQGCVPFNILFKAVFMVTSDRTFPQCTLNCSNCTCISLLLSNVGKSVPLYHIILWVICQGELSGCMQTLPHIDCLVLSSGLKSSGCS